MSLQVGAFDNDFYSGEKSKFEGYHTSLALHDDEPDDDETPLIGNQNKRASYTAPKAVLNENRRMAEESEEDPFKEHVRPTIADREDEYRYNLDYIYTLTTYTLTKPRLGVAWDASRYSIGRA